MERQQQHRMQPFLVTVSSACWLVQAQVTIVDTADPGFLQFEQPSYTVAHTAKHVTVAVVRCRGSAGALMVQYQTQSGTAVEGVQRLPCCHQRTLWSNEPVC